MARQGKMANSPFHVESGRYRYAIEHGEATETYTCPRDCTYYVRATRRCNLWNSGFKTCTAFKCKFYTHRLRTKESCAACQHATIYSDGLVCDVCKKPVQLDEGSYCCYYIFSPEKKVPQRVNKLLTAASLSCTRRFTPLQKKELAEKSKGTPYYGKHWCLTGQMNAIDRLEIVDLIHLMNGIQITGIKDAEIVIRGCAGKETYNAKEARNMIANGAKIILMSEYELLDVISGILLQ